MASEHLDLVRAYAHHVQSFLEEITGPFVTCLSSKGFSTCNTEFDALTSSFAICLGFAIYSFVFSIIGRNCSKVDQLWSITPVVYCWHFVHHYYTKNGEHHQRLLVLTILVTLWGIRLTFNFWRRGGYGNLITHEEDYRWPILREKMHPFMFWIVFNLTFIATYQNVLLWLLTVPAYLVMQGPSEYHVRDISRIAIFSLLLLMETLADQMHWDFHSLKYALTPGERKCHPSKDIRDGFLQSGLFYFSRHPNYFAEQAIWVLIYSFSVSSLKEWLNWSSTGAILLILLFQGSMSFGESITSAKYPAYKDYQKRTSQLIPWFPGKSNKRKQSDPPSPRHKDM